MNSKIVALATLFALTFTLTPIYPKKSEAMSLVAAPGLALGIAGALTTAAGAIALWGGTELSEKASGSCEWTNPERVVCYGDKGWALNLTVLGVVTLVVGIILLPEQTDMPLMAQTLDHDQISAVQEKMGLTDSEAQSFNRDIDEVNAVLENVTDEMLQQKNYSTGFAQKELRIQGAALAPETFSAFTKICAFHMSQI